MSEGCTEILVLVTFALIYFDAVSYLTSAIIFLLMFCC